MGESFSTIERAEVSVESPSIIGNVDRFSGLEEMVLDKKYKLNSVAGKGGKSLLYSGKHILLEMDVMVKFLQDKTFSDPVRRTLFFEEAKRLGKLSSHHYISTVLDAGFCMISDEEVFYLVIEDDKGTSLYESMEQGVEFSLSEIVKVMDHISSATEFTHESGEFNEDIKTKNVRRVPDHRGGCIYKLSDFGRFHDLIKEITASLVASTNVDIKINKLYDVLTNNNRTIGEEAFIEDINGLGTVLNDLLEYSKVHSGLKNIAQRAMTKDPELNFGTADEFRREVLRYHPKTLTRRRFLQTATIIAAGLTVGTPIFKKVDYLLSPIHTQEKIAQTDALNYDKITPLYKELMLRFIDTKIYWLAEKIIPKDLSPYGTTPNGSWHSVEPVYWTAGFWPGILWDSFEISGKEKFKQLALEWTNAIDIDLEKEEENARAGKVSGFRMYDSHGKAFQITKGDIFRRKALKGTELMSYLFGEKESFIKVGSRANLDNSDLEYLKTYSIRVLPLLWFGYKFGEKEHKQRYRDIIDAHLESIMNYNIREDGSVRDYAIVDIKNKSLEGEKNYFGYAPWSCTSMNQAWALEAFVQANKETGNESHLAVAEQLANYFIKHIPTHDYVSSFDLFFDDAHPDMRELETRIKVAKDSSATALVSSQLLELFEITTKKNYLETYYKIMKSLCSSTYLSVSQSDESLLLHTCENINRPGAYKDSSLIYGCKYFFDSLTNLNHRRQVLPVLDLPHLQL